MAFTKRAILPSRPDKADFNGYGFTDLVWQGKDGSLVIWNKAADGIHGVGSANIQNPGNGYSLKGYGDWNGGGAADLIWQNAAGATQTWTMHDNQVAFVTDLLTMPPIQAFGDFNGDGRTDLLWQGSDGVWFSTSAQARKIPPLGIGAMSPISTDFKLVGVGDFDGDGRDDILFRGTGEHQGSMLLHEAQAFKPGDWGMPTKAVEVSDPGADWSVLAIGDFNGDKKADLLWQHTNAKGDVDARSIWLMDHGTVIGGGMVYNPGKQWDFIGTGDYNNDGKTDILVQHKSGWTAEYLMDGNTVTGFGASMHVVGDFWTLGAV